MIGADDTNWFAGGESRFRLEFIANNRKQKLRFLFLSFPRRRESNTYIDNIKTPRPRGVLII